MQEVYIIDGARTPFIKAMGKPNSIPAADLAIAAAKPLIMRQPISPSDIEEVIVGCMIPSADEANIARIIAYRLGCGDDVPAFTVQRNCASGLQAIDCGVKDIALGKHNLVLVGGTEAMSRSPLIYSEKMTNWFAELSAKKKPVDKLKHLFKFKIKNLVPVISLIRGLTDPLVSMGMGQTAEKIAYRFNITRKEMDEFAVKSHLKAVDSYKKGYFDEELVPLFERDGKYYEKDNGIREDSSVEKLAKLKPAFEKPFGKVTAANSSQITDGSAFLLLASKEAVEKHNLKPIAKIKSVEWAALDPTVMGLGPVHSIAKILEKNEVKFDEIDTWEINEAFAAQVIGCVRAMNEPEYCKEKLGLDKPLGEIPEDRLNVNGGAIAVGHPVGASGVRVTLNLLNTLKRNKSKQGIASLCIGGGQGGAILLENLSC